MALHGRIVAEHIELSVPATPGFLSLARLHVGEIARREDTTVEEMELLQLAVEELCVSLVRPNTSKRSRLELLFEWDDERFEARCRISAGPDEPGPEWLGGSENRVEELSRRLLDSLVDEHGISIDDGIPTAWLRSRWSRSGPSP
jgi:hypothetical protein